MNWVDIAIVVVILLSALIGLARGLIRAFLSLIVWACAFGVAYLYYKPVGAALTAYIDLPNVRLGVAFVGLVLVVLILGSILGALLGALIDKTGFTGLDRALGFVFGAALGAVSVAMVVFLLALTPVPEETWWQESKAIAQAQRTADWLLSLIPAEMQERLKRA